MYLHHTEIHRNRGQGLRPINLNKNGIETRESAIAGVIVSGGLRKMSYLRRALATTSAMCGRSEKTVGT